MRRYITSSRLGPQGGVLDWRAYALGQVANWKGSMSRMSREGAGHREVASKVLFGRLRTVMLIEKELETLANGLLRISSGVCKGD